MPSEIPDDLLLIRCPSCNQRFKVGDDLRERTVECGGCEHRFRITDGVIVRGRKFYPSKAKSVGLNRFHRVPLSGGETMIGVQPIRYSSIPDPSILEPSSPQRVMAGIIGGVLMALMAMMLILGAHRGGLLDGMILLNRLLIAGFVSFLGLVLLVYANPRSRMRALLFGMLGSAVLLSLPFIFTEGSVRIENKDIAKPSSAPIPIVAEEVKSEDEIAIDALRAKIGTAPLVSEIKRLGQDGSNAQAMGVWLRGLSDSERFLVRDYMLRITNASPSSHFYPRSGGDYFLVLSGLYCSLEQLAKMCLPLGSIDNLYEEISVIEVSVKGEAFMEVAIDKLSDKGSPQFYELNYKELGSIDLQRVKRAVQRLGDAEPKLFRSDISRKLIELLKQESVDFKESICGALLVWSDQAGPASEAALVALRRLVDEKRPIPTEIVSLMVKEGNLAVVPILAELWSVSPATWETLYGDLGPAAEATLIKQFPNVSGTTRYSAIRILGRVGGAESLAFLQAEPEGRDSELRVLLAKAKKSILSRLNP